MGRRLLVVAVIAGALALAAAAFGRVARTTTSGTQTMDDGVPIAWTLYEPDGAAPAGGWPAIVALHGLGGTKETLQQIAQAFSAAGYAVLAYDARGHGASGGNVELAGPREVADLQAIVSWLARRPEVSDTRIGAWGISYGGGQVWNGLAAGVPLAAAEVVQTWTDLYAALWPQNVAKSGVVGAFATSVAARSPLVAGIAQSAIQGTNLDQVSALAAQRSSLPQLSSVRTPVFLFQGRQDFAFDITQATAAYTRLAGTKKLYVGDFGHAPSTFPGPDIEYVLSQGRLWFDRFLKDDQNGIDAKPPVELAPATWRGTATAYPALPPTTTTTFALPGTSRLRGTAGATRTTTPLAKAAETFGVSSLRVAVTRMTTFPRLVAVLSAVARNGRQTLITQGAVVPHVGSNTIRFGNYAVYVPRGSRLRVTLASTSVAQSLANLVYLPFAGSGSISLGPARLRLSTLRTPVSG